MTNHTALTIVLWILIVWNLTISYLLHRTLKRARALLGLAKRARDLDTEHETPLH